MQRTIDDYQSRAILMRKGGIVPNWILRVTKGQKSVKHNITFGWDVYALPHGDRYVLWPASMGYETIIHIRNIKGVALSAGHGMHNHFLCPGKYTPVTAEKIREFLECEITVGRSPLLLGMRRVKIKGTKLQRRRAKFAAKRAAAQKGGAA